MQYRKLGKTGLTVSVVGIGTFQFGGTWAKSFTQQEVDTIFQAGRDAGINLIDTAECYGDHLAEELIGNAIKTDRQKWIVATKFGHRRVSLSQRQKLWSVKDIRVQLEDSLRALQTDYIDLYQFHSGTNDDFNNDALWSMLNKQVQSGKIRFLGISVSTNNQDFQRYQTDRADSVGAGTIQVRYNRLVRDAEQTVLPTCQRYGLGVLARVPLESGFLSGKYEPGSSFVAEDVRSKKYDAVSLKHFLEEAVHIRNNEVPAGVPMTAWALAWCLKHPAVSCVIPGCKTSEHILQNALAAELDMVGTDHPLYVAVNR